MNFVPSVCWVKRGVAKQKPLEVCLSSKELAAVLRQSKTEVQAQLDELREINDEEDDVDMEDKYAFKNYDSEPTPHSLGIENIIEFDSEASKGISNGDASSNSEANNDDIIDAEDGPENDEDSDAEDDLIHPDDNLILVGHVEEDASVLEVYVYNEEKQYMYVHHDILLPTLPLCLEWLNFDPNNPEPGNMVAIGGMTPEIDIWDLDMVNCIEPAFKLGKHTRDKKYRHKNHGHIDAVLDMSWNKNLQHIIASGSVDMTVLLWDLETSKAATKFRGFTDKVQSLVWHPTEAQTLITGSCDRTVRIFDCRIENTLCNLEVDGEVEKVTWDPVLQYQAFVGTNTGFVYCLDCRNKKFLWQLPAHDMEITGIGLCTNEPGCMVTCSMDGLLKKWNINTSKPRNVWNKALPVGQIHGLDINPDNPSLVAIAGTTKSNNFIVVDVSLA